MSKALHRFALIVYNFLSVLSLTYKNQTYEVSALYAILNLVKMMSSIFFSLSIGVNEYLQREIFLKILLDLKDFSFFARLSVNLVVAFIFVFSALLCFSLVWKSRKICDFVNKVSFSSGIFKPKYFKQFRHACIKNASFMFFVFGCSSIMQYAGSLKLTVLALLCQLIIIYPNFHLCAFLNLVKNFESFIVAQLKQFRNEIEQTMSLQDDSKQVANILELLRRYQNIYNLLEDFNDCFGVSLTIVTFYLTILLIFGVSHQRDV